ncbi:unnamed protein product [Pieris macdunnoughi]|uniref:Uncharacterized protein n=1 Tax=Pieris macdunnoughi TaxID=345717 RepID=A0A821Y3F0_9NEOP|nr:unnamed protein product [Pieris macdunnoughi]
MMFSVEDPEYSSKFWMYANIQGHKNNQKTYGIQKEMRQRRPVYREPCQEGRSLFQFRDRENEMGLLRPVGKTSLENSHVPLMSPLAQGSIYNGGTVTPRKGLVVSDHVSE